MRQAGADIVDPVESSTYEAWRETETAVLLYEFKADLNSYLAARDGASEVAGRLHRIQSRASTRGDALFRAGIDGASARKGSLTEKAYGTRSPTNQARRVKKASTPFSTQHTNWMQLSAPRPDPALLTDWVDGDRADSGCASPPAVAGYPHITVPAGFNFGLPLGISFFGAAWS